MLLTCFYLIGRFKRLCFAQPLRLAFFLVSSVSQPPSEQRGVAVWWSACASAWAPRASAMSCLFDRVGTAAPASASHCDSAPRARALTAAAALCSALVGHAHRPTRTRTSVRPPRPLPCHRARQQTHFAGVCHRHSDPPAAGLPPRRAAMDSSASVVVAPSNGDIAFTPHYDTTYQHYHGYNQRNMASVEGAADAADAYDDACAELHAACLPSAVPTFTLSRLRLTLCFRLCSRLCCAVSHRLQRQGRPLGVRLSMARALG
jgi:hypothetical protein